MKKYALFLALATILFGCAGNTPVPDGYKGALATIHDTAKPQDPTKAYFFELVSVDGRTVSSSSTTTLQNNYGQGFNMAAQENVREVPAAQSVLSIQGVTVFAAPILALGGGDYHIGGNISVNLKPGQHYYVKGVLGKSYSAVWLEDKEGKTVSEKIQQGTPQATATPTVSTGANAQAIFYNTASFLHKVDGSDAITISVDGKEIGTVTGGGEYLKVGLPSGMHHVTLSHRDVIPLTSTHEVEVKSPSIYVRVSPTIMSNSLALGQSLPDGFKESPYKK